MTIVIAHLPLTELGVGAGLFLAGVACGALLVARVRRGADTR